jgi:hypothetical protein
MGRMSACRRAAAAVVVVLTAIVVVAPSARGHGGDEVAAGRNAAYVLSVQASEHRGDDGRRYVDLTAYPIRRSNGAPDPQADVTFQIGDGGPVRAVPRGEGHEALIPADRARAWLDWDISATVRGSAGSLTVTGRPRGRPSDDGPPWLLPAGLLVLLAAGGLVVALRRRRAT